MAGRRPDLELAVRGGQGAGDTMTVPLAGATVPAGSRTAIPAVVSPIVSSWGVPVGRPRRSPRPVPTQRSRPAAPGSRPGNRSRCRAAGVAVGDGVGLGEGDAEGLALGVAVADGDGDGVGDGGRGWRHDREVARARRVHAVALDARAGAVPLAEGPGDDHVVAGVRRRRGPSASGPMTPP